MEQSIAFLVGVILVLVIMNIIRSTRLNSRVTSLEDDLETIHDWVDEIEEELQDVREELADLTSMLDEGLDNLDLLEERNIYDMFTKQCQACQGLGYKRNGKLSNKLPEYFMELSSIFG